MAMLVSSGQHRMILKQVQAPAGLGCTYRLPTAWSCIGTCKAMVWQLD